MYPKNKEWVTKGRVIKVKFTTRLRFITEGVSLVICEDPRNIQDQTGFSCNLCFTSLDRSAAQHSAQTINQFCQTENIQQF